MMFGMKTIHCCSRRVLAVLAWLSVSTVVSAGEAPVFGQQVLFRSGTGKTHTFRIPALVTTARGTILVFCEARRESSRDHSNIDLVMKRSDDGGASWGPTRLLFDDANHAIGNPCPVLDRRTGTIWLPFSRNNRQVLLSKSSDDGKTWSKPIDITRSVLPSEWGWVGPGPGHGIQLRHGRHAGRLVIPAWSGIEKDVPFGRRQLSYAFYSDDAGKTWQYGKPSTVDHSDECEVVELADGRLYMNARSRMGKKLRAYCYSSDGGSSWSSIAHHVGMPERSCQGSLVRVGKNAIVVAHPSDTGARRVLTVRLSRDEAKTWPVSRVAEVGPAAYSDMATNRSGDVLLAYEGDNYKTVKLVRFNLAWLTAGK